MGDLKILPFHPLKWETLPFQGRSPISLLHAMPPSKRAKRTELAGPLASEPDAPVPPASAADAPVPPEPGAASPPAPGTGEDTILKKKKLKEFKESFANWNHIEYAVRRAMFPC